MLGLFQEIVLEMVPPSIDTPLMALLVSVARTDGRAGGNIHAYGRLRVTLKGVARQNARLLPTRRMPAVDELENVLLLMVGEVSSASTSP